MSDARDVDLEFTIKALPLGVDDHIVLLSDLRMAILDLAAQLQENDAEREAQALVVLVELLDPTPEDYEYDCGHDGQ